MAAGGIRNLAKFNSGLAAFQAEVILQATRIQRVIAFELLRRIIIKTPVDTGRARNNWQVTINEPAEGESNDPQASSTGVSTINSVGLGQTIFITNNVPYIIFLEEGSSGQAPAGMLEISISEVAAIFGGI